MTAIKHIVIFVRFWRLQFFYLYSFDFHGDVRECVLQKAGQTETLHITNSVGKGGAKLLQTDIQFTDIPNRHIFS